MGTPRAFRGTPCTFCVPRVNCSSDLGFQKWPLSATWALFGITFRGFARTMAAHVWHACFSEHPGWDSGAKWLESVCDSECLAFRGITTRVKTDVLTQSNFFLKFAQESSAKTAQSHLLVPFWATFCVLVPAFWCALGQLWHTWGPTVDLVEFRVAGHVPGLGRRQRRSTLWGCGKTALGLPGIKGIRTFSKVAVCAPANVSHLNDLLYLKR